MTSLTAHAVAALSVAAAAHAREPVVTNHEAISQAVETASVALNDAARALSISEADIARGSLLDAIVVIQDGSAAGRAIDAVSPIEAQLTRDGVIISSETLFTFGGQTVPVAGRSYRLVKLAPGHDATIVAALLADAGELIAEPVAVGKQMNAAPEDRPNDPLFGQQYALENTGQSVNGVSGQPAADIGVVAAWERQTGSSDVTIAIIDAGVSSTHPDLYQKLIPGYNIFGPDHTNTDALYNAHGTQVAGVAAATTNNEEGVTGVSWGSQIMPVTAANVLGFTSDAWLAEGLVWAVDNGADVAVLSFGLANPTTVLQDAVRHAQANGVAVFASAGNTGEDRVFYPAAFVETIAVGATDSHDELAHFSNRGPEVDIVAPGVDIFTCYHTVTEPDTYVYASGTSVATPMVAGVAALLLSADPGLTPFQIRNALMFSSKDLGEEGQDPGYGYGRLDARAALARALGEGTCRADINNDGVLSESDFTAWVSAYNTGSLRADQNNNQVVDPGDFTAFVANVQQRYGCRPLNEAD